MVAQGRFTPVGICAEPISALAHKILRIVYAMLNAGIPYQDRSVNCRALRMARNTPRCIKMLKMHGLMPELGQS